MNVYAHNMGETTQKKVLTHRKKITALVLTQEHLITGDQLGCIYIWTLGPEPVLKTFEIHKDKGAITNLIATGRPLSLFGLTANMLGYEPGELKPLSKTVNELSGNLQVNLRSYYTREPTIEDGLADLEELDFLCQMKQTKAVTQASRFVKDSGNEVEQLREENRRLKRTFLERFN